VLDYLLDPPVLLVLTALISSCLIILLIRLFRWGRETSPHFSGRTAALLATVIYPSLFLVYLVRLAEFPHTLPVVILFLILNFGNDTLAYLAGRFLGAGSGHIFAVSPKKTVAGFLGGFAGAVVLGTLFALYRPDLFTVAWHWRIAFFLLIAVSADLGDLIESALKRGAEKKDSGRVIPGRGGMLDTIDSLLFSAPVFYYIGLVIFM
jgi:phosphatidate cytidylyltransferase